MDERKPQPGDHVQVSFSGEWIDDDRGRAVYDPVSGWRYDVPKEAVVEVLEPADDPRKELDGSVRKDPEFEKPDRVVVAVHPVRVDGPRWRSVSGDYYRRDEEVIGWVRLAPVAGTPAAEAQSTVDAATLFPPPAGTAPRVFRSDGPEPPEDVQCLQWLYGPRSAASYLQRRAHGWAWVTAPGAEPEFSETPLHWCPAAVGEFREVLS